MIDTREVRIGNYVYKTDNRTLKKERKKVFCIQPAFLSLDDVKGNPCDIHFIEPIPLDENILLDYGFTLIGQKYYSTQILDKLGLGIGKDNGVFMLLYVTDIAPNGFIILPMTNSIKYLHQFQNLYFDLVGEELQTEEERKKKG
ncbi:hypothetical protein DXD68_04355 [Parabacteroides sp. TM07-1AC]|uniref:hypothetical protein n=1 Tax=Parabacteroides sp. TM07-1AC TaxID=2292363 RepID=UPI000EFFC257|nr:hypothetical protein [Parabacteroides sp. TM07-1AC]RHU31026.1 hypothetical protein DXD68_04355 [Parabacteroides sp. TM07-1AC]